MERVLIVGGTGTLGEATIRALPKAHITVFSRSEHKQAELHRKYGVTCIVGDLRERDSVKKLFRKSYDTVLHYAALKRVDTMEEQPEESVRTNILGTINLLDAVRESDTQYFVFSSSDKAVSAENCYGACKYISERLVLNENRNSDCVYSVTRWGNIIGSNGSVIPIFVKNILEGKPVIITHGSMSRFWIKIDEAVQFLLKNYRTKSNKPKIPSIRCAPVLQVVSALEIILGKKAIVQIGIVRPGEKIFESLISHHSNEPKIDSNNAAFGFTMEELVEYLRPEIESMK